MTVTAVQQYQVGKLCKAFVLALEILTEAPFDDLSHAGVVVLFKHRLYAELFVALFAWSAVLENHHARHHVCRCQI